MQREMFSTCRLWIAVAAIGALVLAVDVHAQATWQSSGNGEIHTNPSTANVGIGVTSPDSKMTIGGGEIFRFQPNPVVRLLDMDFNHLYGANPANNGAAFRMDLRWDVGQPAFMWMTRAAGEPIPPGNQTVKMSMLSNGNLGIGVVVPQAKLDVAGNAQVSGNLSVTGTVTGGNIQAQYQDMAEWVPAEEKIAPATVVVLDPERPNHVMPSSTAYDSAVAGVISARPGIILGVADESKVKVATTGRVMVRVDATAAPVRIGDLLVTSDKPGVAMRSMPVDVNGIKMHRPGTVIGKALEPLPSGEGEILVLLSLQ